MRTSSISLACVLSAMLLDAASLTAQPSSTPRTTERRETHWVVGHFEDVKGTFYSSASRKTIAQLQELARRFCGMVRFGPFDDMVPLASGREFSIYVPKESDVREVYRQACAAVGDGFRAVNVGYGQWPNVGTVSEDYRKDWARAECPGVSLPLPR